MHRFTFNKNFIPEFYGGDYKEAIYKYSTYQKNELLNIIIEKFRLMNLDADDVIITEEKYVPYILFIYLKPSLKNQIIAEGLKIPRSLERLYLFTSEKECNLDDVIIFYRRDVDEYGNININLHDYMDSLLPVPLNILDLSHIFWSGKIDIGKVSRNAIIKIDLSPWIPISRRLTIIAMRDIYREFYIDNINDFRIDSLDEVTLMILNYYLDKIFERGFYEIYRRALNLSGYMMNLLMKIKNLKLLTEFSDNRTNIIVFKASLKLDEEIVEYSDNKYMVYVHYLHSEKDIEEFIKYMKAKTPL